MIRPFATTTPGDGPRHIAFHPNGRFVYVINEMGQTVTAFHYDSDRGALKTFQEISTVPEGFQSPNTTAEVQVHPSGKFLYGSNRGPRQHCDLLDRPDHRPADRPGPSIERRQDPAELRHRPGPAPGSWRLIKTATTSSSFAIDAQTGLLKPTGQSITSPCPSA